MSAERHSGSEKLRAWPMHGEMFGNDADKVRELQLLNKPAVGVGSHQSASLKCNIDLDVPGVWSRLPPVINTL